MKKIVSLLLALCLMCLLVSAVAEMDFAGTTWYLVSFEQDGNIISAADFGMEIVMTLNDDGTCGMLAYGEETTGSWSIDGEAVTITDDSGTAQNFTLDEEGSLVAEMDGGKMIFSQVAPEAPAPAEVLKAESEEEFFGTYKPVSASIMGIEMPLEQLFSDAVVFTVEEGKLITAMGEGDDARTEENPTAFEDGVLKMYAAEGDETVVATIQLAEDGSVSIIMEEEGMTLTITTEKVEVAVAE